MKKNFMITMLEKRLKQSVGRVCQNAYNVYVDSMRANGLAPIEYEEFLEKIKVRLEDIE